MALPAAGCSEVVHQRRQQPNQPVQLQQPSWGARAHSILVCSVQLAPALVQVCLNLAASALVSHLVNAGGAAPMPCLGSGCVPHAWQKQHKAVQVQLLRPGSCGWGRPGPGQGQPARSTPRPTMGGFQSAGSHVAVVAAAADYLDTRLGGGDLRALAVRGQGLCGCCAGVGWCKTP